MPMRFDFKMVSSIGRCYLIGLCLADPAFAEKAQNPEQYKQELLVIEKRLETKLKILDEKLNRLEALESLLSKSVAGPDNRGSTPNNDTDLVAAPPLPEGLKAIASDPSSSEVSYGKNGFEVKTEDGQFALALENRIQFRYANPFDSDPRSLADLDREQSSFMIRRGRTKFKGHAYWPWLKYYLQYDWSQPVLRDLSLTMDKYPWAKLMVGRGKVLYNEERVTSSGNQQFVNRSIVNDLFTVDRQQGIQLYGNLFPDMWYDLSYYAGIYSGTGVSERNNDDDNMMYSARVQWNALGGEMEFSQSDLKFHKKPVLNFAFAAATNQSRCTAFETDHNSCRSLPGVSIGQDGQFRINQMMEEIHFKWQGLSIKHELHWKQVTDTLADQSTSKRETDLMGGLIQAGYFPHYLLAVVPKNLEIAGRYAFVDPNTSLESDRQIELSGVMTFFLNGHSNKVNFQVSHLTVETPQFGIRQSDQRYWLQWDLSF